MPFEAVPQPKRKSAVVVEQILAAVQTGELVDGDKLPSERELAEQMGVSRNSVREALSALQIGGLLETRTGSGTYIVDSRIANADVSHLMDHVRGSTDLLKIWEARREIETTLVRLAAERSSPGDLRDVRAALHQMEEAVRKDDEQEYLRTNTLFHAALAVCADNPPLRDAYAILEAFTHRELLDGRHQPFVVNGLHKALVQHGQIFTAVQQGDSSAAESALREHYSELESYLRQELAQQTARSSSS